MTIREEKFAALTATTQNAPINSKRFHPSIKSAVSNLGSILSGVEATPDAQGFVRHLTAANGLSGSKFLGDAKAHAVAFLNSGNVVNTFDLSKLDVDLNNGVARENAFGHQVMFQQSVTFSDGSKLPLRGGKLNVTMDKEGKIYNVTSELKHGRVMSKRGAITEAEAIEIAKAKFSRLAGQLSKANGKEYAKALRSAVKTCTAKVNLVASEDKGKIDAVYEVVLGTGQPRQLIEFLIKAKTGEIVYWASKLHYSVSSKAQQAALGRIAAKCLLKDPDPNKPINQQVVDYYVENLPDPKVLANERYKPLIEVNGQWVPVTAAADGTYNFSSTGKDRDKFCAVVAFIVLNLQSEINESWGLNKQTRAIPVYINDKSVQDNAYFDPENYEIHIGVGSGTDAGGLTEMIVFCIGVLLHENRHHEVYLQTPGKDMPGPQGGACNEATADVHGQLLIEYVFAIMFGKITGQNLTVADIVKDPRIIGLYAMPPHGIRNQRNTKTVADQQGEVHADGEIVGAAMADALQGYVEQPDVASGKISLADQLANYGRAGQLLMTLLPTRSVRFTDWRRCHITADQQLTGGVNRAVIEKAFDAHGITASSTAPTKPKTKGKGKGGNRKAPGNRRRVKA
jgi:uncharacterized membrane protein YkoI